MVAAPQVLSPLSAISNLIIPYWGPKRLLVVGGLATRALIFGVYLRAPGSQIRAQ